MKPSRFNFRAWDKKCKKMYPCDMNVSIRPLSYLECIFRGCEQYANKDMILMQSTGLVDKNGVEIYEGDDLEITINYSCSIKQNVTIVWSDHLSCFMFSHPAWTDFIPVSEVINNCVIGSVIGNIHQHPHLLKS